MAASGIVPLPVVVFHFRVAVVAQSAASCVESRPQRRYQGELGAVLWVSGLY